jgi:tRNA(Ile)-lysidine synthase
MAFTADRLYQVLSGWPRPSRYRVALSGGLDSTVLLHALASLRERLDAPLAAIHADHGLQAGSAAWTDQCAKFCAALDIPFEGVRLGLKPAPGESIEAVARQARYAAFAATMQPGELLLSAQHRDDQAETVLLQLLRGAGVAGLAAMPALSELGPGSLGRPLLEVTRAQLAAYASEHDLEWIEDPSNAALDFDRNYLRHEVVPRLKARWPAAAETLSRSASHCATADQALRALAADDLAQCRLSEHRLAIAPLLQLPAERRNHLLRAWIACAGLPLPPTHKLERVLLEVIPARPDAAPLVTWPGAELRRYRDALWLTPPLPPAEPDWQADWSGAQALLLPAGLGELTAEQATGGIDPARWQAGRKRVGFRREGLSCTPVGRQGSRPLKKLFQELGVPPWLRERVPLLFIDGELAAVGDLCVCAPFATSAPGGDGMRLQWQRPDWCNHIGTEGRDAEQ